MQVIKAKPSDKIKKSVMYLFRIKEFLLFTLLLKPVQGESATSEIQIMGSKNYGILILCKFDDQYEGEKKYFCKGNHTTCPYNHISHSKDSRVSQYENTYGNYLAVNITNLTLEDAGTYHCAVENGGFEHNMILNITEGDCCDSHTTEPQRYSIQCKHPMESKQSTNHCCQQDTKFIRYLKEVNQSHKHYQNHSLDAGVYWCRVRTGGPPLITGGTTQHINIKGFAGGGVLIHCTFHNQATKKSFCRGNATVCTKDSRTWLHKNVLWGFLTVIILNLTSNDNGTYHFMEDNDVRAKVHLHVVEGDCCGPSMTINKDQGENVTIPCKYPGELTINDKHLCKAREGCKPLGSEPNTKQKYSLSDNKHGNSFTVTIHDLEKEDAGSYWCAVKANEYSAILLNNVVLNISDTDTKTPVLVVIVVLLLAVIVFLCYKDRQGRKHGRSNKVIDYTTENPDPDRIYEEIEDIGLPPCPVTSSTCTVDKTNTPNYCTIQSPLNFTDETRRYLLSKGTHSPVITTVYTTAQLPTVTTPFPTTPGDVPTYSNIQSLTRTIGADKTESSDNSVYANVQEPTDPNDGPTTYPSDDTDAQINTVYVTAEFTTNITSSNLSVCAEQMPLNPMNDPTQLSAQEHQDPQ